MSKQEAKRHRGLADDAVGGLTTFLIEVAIVAGMALVALILSAAILLLV